jgi:hypothetical protein
MMNKIPINILFLLTMHALVVISTISSIKTKRDTVVLMAGEVRSFNLTKESILDHLLILFDADVGMCIYGDDDYNATENVYSDRLIFKKFIPSTFNATNDHLFTLPDNGNKDEYLRIPLHCNNESQPDEHDYVDINIIDALNWFNKYKYSLLQGHVSANQLFTLYYCIRSLRKYEIENNVKYDIVIRHRFDSALWSDYPLEYKHIFKRKQEIGEKATYIPFGLDYFSNGINDRLSISTRDAADAVFSSFFNVYLTFTVFNGSCIKYCNGAETIIYRRCERPINFLANILPEISLKTLLFLFNVTIFRDDMPYHCLLNTNGTCRYDKLNPRGSISEYDKLLAKGYNVTKFAIN